MKKRHFILAIFAMLFTTTTFAQEVWYDDTYRYNGIYEGSIIYPDGDTAKGFIEYNSRTDMQTKCVFYTDKNDKKSKVVYKPESLKGYIVAGKVYRAIHYSGGLSAGPVRFLWLQKDGRIAEYKWFDLAENASMMQKASGESQADFEARQYPSKIIFQKLDEKPFEHSALALSFAKKMSELTADYPELSQKVANKADGYGMLKMFDIIAEYNAYFANKK